MLIRYLACSCLAVALLFAMAVSASGDGSCEHGDRTVGISTSVPSPHESIGTGTMTGDTADGKLPVFGVPAWDAILGIDARPKYNGPWRDGAGQ